MKAGEKNAFTSGCSNFKMSAIKEHASGSSHQSALSVPEQVENKYKIDERQLKDTTRRVMQRIKLVKWLAKDTQETILPNYGR